MSADTPSDRPAEARAADTATKTAPDTPAHADRSTSESDARDASTYTDTPTQRLVRYENRPLDDTTPPTEPTGRTETATEHLLDAKRESPDPSPAHGEWAELTTTPNDQPRDTEESVSADRQGRVDEAGDPPADNRTTREADQAAPTSTADRPQEVIDTDRPAITQDYYTNIPPVDHRPYTEPVFDGPPTREQAVQGTVGDCGIVSTFGAVAEHRPDAIRNAITDRGDGTYDITLHNIDSATPSNPVATPTGDTTTYRISNELPVSLAEPGEPLAGARPDTGAWPALLEKTVAAEDQTWNAAKNTEWEHDWQSVGKFAVDSDRIGAHLPPSPDTPPMGYNRIDLGSTSHQRADLLAKLTGEQAEVRPIPDQQNGPQALLDEFREQLDDGKPVLVGSRGGIPGELVPFQHFAFGHAYEVTKIDGDGIHLRNPWGEAYNPAPIDARTFREYYGGEYTTFK